MEFLNFTVYTSVHIKQTNEQMNKDKNNNNLQHTTQITKDQATQTSLNTGGEVRCSGRVNVL